MSHHDDGMQRACGGLCASLDDCGICMGLCHGDANTRQQIYDTKKLEMLKGKLPAHVLVQWRDIPQYEENTRIPTKKLLELGKITPELAERFNPGDFAGEEKTVKPSRARVG